jgi:transcriptional regulator with XRE-family HTH domain
MSATIERSPGALIAELRERMGLSQEELGAAAGVSAQTVRNLEHGSRRPHRSTATVLAGVLGCSAEDLRRPVDA